MRPLREMSVACPMDVEVNREARKRKNGTECILSMDARRCVPQRHCIEMWDIFGPIGPIERKKVEMFLGICYNKKSPQNAKSV